MSFTTGTAGGPTSSDIAFTKVSLSTAQNRQFCSINMGPDGKLYCGTMTGEIIRYGINADGTLSSPYVINTVKNHEGAGREVIGIAFDPASTATNLIAWVTHNYVKQFGAPNHTSKLSKLTGSNLQNIKDEIVNLPRSYRDHMVLKDVFGPDGKLYFCSGAMTGMGGPDAFWGNLPEETLSGVILQVDTTALDAYVSKNGALNAKTKDVGGSYDPFASGAPMKVYATGVRNSYDLLFHSNGTLYSAVNGSAPGENTPAGPGVPALTNVQENEPDWVFKIYQGKYYGHPNPVLGHYVLNGGNPTSGTDLFEVYEYPVGIKPDAKWQPASYKVGNNYSPNGMIEYQSTSAFGGALRHSILITRYSAGDDVMIMTPDANGNFPSGSVKTGIPGLTGLSDPVDLIEHNGNLYIVEFAAQRISLFRPNSSGGGGGGGSTTSFSGFELINADTDKDAGVFQSGSVIDFSKVGTKNVNVRADVSGTAGSVRFGIDSNSNFRTENGKPYALAGDDAGDYYAWTPSVGTHTFTATIYGGSNGAGSVLATKSFTFTVTSGTTPSGTGVKTFSLVNADTGAFIRTITEGSTIDFAALPTQRVAVRADVSGTAGSVRFGYEGNSNYSTENKAPFALMGDAGDGIHYTLWAPDDGSETLTATAYSGANATGSVLGSPLTMHFTVINA
jgi:glucose/arabinose dehydrogenase